ncbi:FadR/GntR family transcriptional regulator, partial [Kitasatospora sp. NPDC058965]|uniref:FadR/GntR family transcriptional regulator n=1 Tax=Kitasatospora sp. NPDC058965 TaxID=3346682 RepID=UPI003695D67C
MISPDHSRFGNGRAAGRQRQVTEEIKRYILANRLQPGDLLPTEAELCAALGASRSSVREAVKTLDALDIVRVRHGHGTYVGSLSLSALVESLAFRGLLSPDDDFRVLAELVEVRELFERGMAERIIGALRPTHLAVLDGLVDEMAERIATGGDLIATDRRFHALLLEPLANELIGQLSAACWDVHAIVAPHLNVITDRDEADTVQAHRAMVGAVRAADPAAFTAAVHAHYAPVRRRIAAARA